MLRAIGLILTMDLDHFKPTTGPDLDHFMTILGLWAWIWPVLEDFDPFKGYFEGSGPDLDHFRAISRVLGPISTIFHK